MKQESIYLVYETDIWLSYNNRTLIYIGTNLTCVASAMACEYDLSDEQIDEFIGEGSLGLTASDGSKFKLYIDTQLTNAFVG